MDTVKFEQDKISAFIEFADPIRFHDTLNKENYCGASRTAM